MATFAELGHDPLRVDDPDEPLANRSRLPPTTRTFLSGNLCSNDGSRDVSPAEVALASATWGDGFSTRTGTGPMRTTVAPASARSRRVRADPTEGAAHPGTSADTDPASETGFGARVFVPLPKPRQASATPTPAAAAKWPRSHFYSQIRSPSRRVDPDGAC
jgi:hypothetical protein